MAKGNFNKLIQSEIPVLIDFHAEWCGPCKMMSPIIKDIKSEFGDPVRIVKIDIDKNPKLASKYKIRGVPTLMMYQKGELIWNKVGMASFTDIKTAFETNGLVKT